MQTLIIDNYDSFTYNLAQLLEKVSGTPTMIITKMIRRYPVPGPVSYEVLSKFLDSILN